MNDDNWTLDETSGTVMHNAAGSVHGENNGALVGRPGRFDTAYDFFGPSWVDTHSRPIPATGDFSLFAWVLTKQGDTATLLSGHRQQAGRWNIFMTADGELSFFHHGGVGVRNTDFIINDGQWRHIGVTREGETFTVWLDGVGQEVGASDAAMNTDYNLIFGGRLTAAGELTERFLGAIDDVQVYHRALAGEEVAHIMLPEPGSAVLLGTGADGQCSPTGARAR